MQQVPQVLQVSQTNGVARVVAQRNGGDSAGDSGLRDRSNARFSFRNLIYSSANQPHWWGALAVIVAAAVASPSAVFARSPMRGHASASRRVAAAPAPISVSVGWTGGAERDTIVNALSAAVAQEPRFQWTTQRGVMVVNATVRTLATTHEGTDSLVRCEVALVVTDGAGAVRATLDTRRVLRSSSEPSSLEQDALRSALSGAMHRLATSI